MSQLSCDGLNKTRIGRQVAAEYRLDLVEQPVSRHDLKGLELVTRCVPVVVEADEAAGTLDEIMTLVGNRMPKDVYDVGQKVEVLYEDHPAEGFTLPRFRIVD